MCLFLIGAILGVSDPIQKRSNDLHVSTVLSGVRSANAIDSCSEIVELKVEYGDAGNTSTGYDETEVRYQEGEHLV